MSVAPVVSRWLWPGNRTFLEVDSMVVSWWILVAGDFFCPVYIVLHTRSISKPEHFLSDKNCKSSLLGPAVKHEVQPAAVCYEAESTIAILDTSYYIEEIHLFN